MALRLCGCTVADVLVDAARRDEVAAALRLPARAVILSAPFPIPSA